MRQSFVPSAASFGSNLAGNVADIAAKIYERKQAATDDAALLEFDNTLAGWEHARLHDPQSGVLNTVKGKDALDLPNTLGDEFDQMTSEAIDKLQPRQQQAAQRLAQRRREGIVSTLDSYGSREADAYEDAQVDASLKTSVQLGIANATDPVRLKNELDRQELVIAGEVQRKGLPPEVRDRKIQEFRTATLTGAIDQLLTLDRDQAAQALFDATKNQIDGDKWAAIEKALEDSSLRRKGQQAADAIGTQAKTLSEARDLVKAIEDPKLRDEVQQRVEHDWAVREKIEQDQSEQALVNAYNLVESGGLSAVQKTPLWRTLTGGARSSLRAYAKQLVEGTRATVKTDYETLYALIRQSAEDPEAFAKQPLLSYKHKLSDGDFEQMARLQASVISGGKKQPGVLDDYRTELQTVDGVLTEAGINPEPGKDDADARSKVAWLRGKVAEEVRRVQSVTGKKATNEELEAIARRMLGREVLDRGTFWNSTQPLMNAQSSDVPDVARQQIIAAFKQRGVANPTDQQILLVWLDSQVSK